VGSEDEEGGLREVRPRGGRLPQKKTPDGKGRPRKKKATKKGGRDPSKKRDGKGLLTGSWGVGLNLQGKGGGWVLTNTKRDSRGKKGTVGEVQNDSPSRTTSKGGGVSIGRGEKQKLEKRRGGCKNLFWVSPPHLPQNLEARESNFFEEKDERGEKQEEVFL